MDGHELTLIPAEVMPSIIKHVMKLFILSQTSMVELLGFEEG